MILKSDKEIGKFSYYDMECPRRTRPISVAQFPLENCKAWLRVSLGNLSSNSLLFSKQVDKNDHRRSDIIYGCSLEVPASLHCKCLQGFTGFPQFFSAISMDKRSKNPKETLYSSKGRIVYVVGNPCSIYRLQGNPIVIIGFSLQSVNVFFIITPYFL